MAAAVFAITAQLKNIVAPKFRGQIRCDKGVIGLILTQRDCVIIPVQFQHMLGHFGQHITVKDWDAQITGTAQISVVCIGNHNRHIQIMQKCPELRAQTGAPNDQNTRRIPASQPQGPRHRG